jgi:ferredoxin-NADP reductase
MEFETTVAEIIRRNSEVKSFRFLRPASFQFLPGQFLMVTIRINGEKKTEYFSISSSPTESEYIEFTKRITSHEFSTALDNLQVGDTVYLNGPYGEFTFTGEYPKVVMIAGGIGITPFMSMIGYCTDNTIPAAITLLYGNRSEESTAYKEELAALMQKNSNMRIVHCLSRPEETWKGRRGHLDLTTIREEVPDYKDASFYLCGPPALVEDLERVLLAEKIPEDRVHVESFLGY